MLHLCSAECIMPFCTQCGATLDAGDRFCRECGVEVRAAPPVASARPPVALSSTPAFPSRPDPPLVEDLPSRDETDASRAVLLGPAGPQNPLSFSAPVDESPARRLRFIIGCFLIVALSGWAGYRWFSRPTPDARAVAVEATEQSLESTHGAPHTQPTGPADRPRPESAAEAATRSEAPRGGEVWTVIAEFTRETTDAANALGAPDGRIAIVASGGSLALAAADGQFYNGHGPDVRVHGPLGHRAPYIILARSGPEDAWAQFDVNRKGFSDGTASHDFGHHGITHAQQIMIRNDGTSPLYVDAITPLYRQPESHGDDKSPGHEDPR